MLPRITDHLSFSVMTTNGNTTDYWRCVLQQSDFCTLGLCAARNIFLISARKDAAVVFSRPVKIQAMECSIVVGCYESPVGLRKRTLKRSREHVVSKISMTNDHVTAKRIVRIFQCIVDQFFRPLIKHVKHSFQNNGIYHRPLATTFLAPNKSATTQLGYTAE